MRKLTITLAALLAATAAFAQQTTHQTTTTTTTIQTNTAPVPAPVPATPKETPPPPATAKPFALPAITKFELPNGLRVRLVPYGSVPKVTVRLAIQTGTVDEAPNEIWLARITGELLQQGTATQSADQINRRMASMGSDLDVVSGTNDVTIGADVFSDAAPDLISLIADVVEHPLMPESELPRIKQNALRQLSIQRSQPQPLAAERFYSALFPNTPYGRFFPSEAMLGGYTAEQVRAFYNRNYGASRARLYVVGVFDAAAVERAIRTSFDSWQRGNPPTMLHVTPVAKRTVYVIDRPGAVQSTLFIGLPAMEANASDYVSFITMDSLLGGSFGSRITSNIREQKGYTYSPRSQVGTRLGAGSWVETADVTTKDTGASIHEILGEIERLRLAAPPQEELAAIQRNEAGTFVIRNSARGAIANQLAFVDLHGLGEDYLRDFVQRVYALTPADVQHAAQYLDPSKIAIVVVGDKKVIMDQLKQYGDIVE